MYRASRSSKNILLGFKNEVIQISKGRTLPSSSNHIKMDKILIISKMTRYEHERRKLQGYSDDEFEMELRNRGTNFEKLVHHHTLQKTVVAHVADTLSNMGSEIRVVNRFSYEEENVHWADLIVPVGGDGTFLLAASKVRNNLKPVAGINSDPSRSEGYLCLPKKYSTNIKGAFEKLQMGKFRWMLRNRIRTKIMGNSEIEPQLLHEKSDCDIYKLVGEIRVGGGGRILPTLALNEVFIGETLSARVSHLTVKFNECPNITHLKCSGICLSTGTGSTSWHLSMNRLPVQSVAELLRLLDIDPTEDKNSLATVLSDIYNKNLIFPPDDKRMGYTIRDIISAGVWPHPKGIKSRGFITKMELKSNCYEAYLVIDGGIAYSFNDGTTAIFEMCPEDSLRTVLMTD